MSRPAQRRYPWEMLERLLDVDDVNRCELARRIGVDARTVERYRHEGVPERQADAIALALGLHLELIWPAEEMRRYRRRLWQRANRQRPDVAARKRAHEQRYYDETGDYVRARERARYWADPETARARKRVSA